MAIAKRFQPPGLGVVVCFTQQKLNWGGGGGGGVFGAQPILNPCPSHTHNMEEAYSKHTHRHKKKNTERHTQTHTHKHTHTHTQTQPHKTCRKHTTKSGFGLGTSFSATPCSATWILTSVFFSVFFRCSSFFLSL